MKGCGGGLAPSGDGIGAIPWQDNAAKSNAYRKCPSCCVSVCCNHFLCINSLTPPDSPLRWIFCYHPHFTDEQTKPQGAYLPKVTQLVITKIRSKPRQPGSESMHPATAAHCLSVDQTRDDWMGRLTPAPEAGAGWICSRDAPWVGTLCVWPERVPSQGLAGWLKFHPQAPEEYYWVPSVASHPGAPDRAPGRAGWSHTSPGSWAWDLGFANDTDAFSVHQGWSHQSCLSHELLSTALCPYSSGDLSISWRCVLGPPNIPVLHKPPTHIFKPHHSKHISLIWWKSNHFRMIWSQIEMWVHLYQVSKGLRAGFTLFYFKIM